MEWNILEATNTRLLEPKWPKQGSYHVLIKDGFFRFYAIHDCILFSLSRIIMILLYYYYVHGL